MTGNRTHTEGPPPFDTALEDHGPRLHAWLLARVGPSRADDVFQETMLAALAAWDRVPVQSVRAWLFTIARNKAIDEQRRDANRPRPEGEVDSWPSAEVAERLEDPVWDQVRELPEKQRIAVTLRFRGDLNHREIGTVMEISEAAARRNVFEGVKRLRERIEDE
ncbi:MAG TPA: RNA polymerase sigma factor [Solirubrobacterales bacterium]|nr:RNA polymerase sigma factor [Solirubrobacterales bacterium]